MTELQRFHVSSTRKRSMPTRRSAPVHTKQSAARNQNTTKLMQSAPPTLASASIPMLKTDARLPVAETALREHTTETPAWKTIATAQAKAPTIAPKPKTTQEQTAAGEGCGQ